MRRLYQIAALFRALFRANRIDADVADEMRFHVDRETAANMSRGMTPDAARRAARLTFGSVDANQESTRDDRPGAGVRQFFRDIRFGARLLRKAPVFGFTGVGIVALGIGAATAIFSVVYGVLLRPLPYREPERLVSIWLERSMGHSFPSAADVAELRRLPGVFTDVALVRSSTNLNLVGDGEPRRLLGARVSPNLFTVLGVSPAIGRSFATDEDQPGREHVVLLGDALWRARYGGDSAIVGRQIQINGAPHTVLGVMPPGLQFPSNVSEAWVPAVLEPGELTREQINNYRVVARLDPRTTLEGSRAAATSLAKRLGASYRWNSGAGIRVDSMLDDAVRTIRPALRLLLGAVAFLLLIACVNLSNLFGARATARSGEFAVRLALGASRQRLVTQAIAESAPVLALGGLLGVLVANVAVRAFVMAAPQGMPRVESIAMSVPVAVFALVVLVLAGCAASVAPAVQAWASDFTTVTKDGGRSSTAGRARTSARRIGVAMQIAFALPLLVGASLLIKSALAVQRVELGFQPAKVGTVSFEVVRAKHPTDAAVADYYTRIVEATRALPGVATAALANRIPLQGAQTNPVHFENSTGSTEEFTDIDSRTVTPDYFATLGIGLISGRSFTEQDDAAAPRVGIVDDRIAHTIWPGQSAIGKRFRGPDGQWTTVVGIVGHIRSTSPEVDPRPQVYWSYRQWTQNRMTLAVRSRAEPGVPLASVITAIRSVDPEQSVYDVRTLRAIVDASLAQRRVTTLLMIGFSAIALLLAAVGIYGVVAYGVTQRLREFGIRVALGATRGDVTRSVVWQGTSMAIVGAIVGLALAVGAASAMSSLVYGVAPRDAVSILGATVVLLLVTVVASYFPARRAAAVDPGVTLRAE